GLAALLVTGLLVNSAAACSPRTNLPDVEDEVMCTICGTLLAESDSPQAEGERALIRNLISQCRTKDQIKDALVAQYGPNDLATPIGHGFDLTAWIVPGLVIGLVLAGLGVGAYRLSRRPRAAASPPLDAADAARLDADMGRQDH
ncbi:MAG: cytochrome c-type biogenesis protein CcmH, partial [Solirubrobacterales bacterium]